MERTIYVVVTCTDRKKRAPRASLRDCGAPDPKQRFKEWKELLQGSRNQKVSARELYAGDHWSVVRSIPKEAKKRGLKVKLFIVSAGYGLIPCDGKTQLVPYGATFSGSHPDSVGKGEDLIANCQAWWAELGKWKGPTKNSPRSIKDLARHKKNEILIAASPVYLKALQLDLRAALEGESPESDRILIFSTGSQPLEGLERAWVPCDARLQSAVYGSRQSLNVRILREAIRSYGKNELTAKAQRQKFRGKSQRAEPLVVYDRTKRRDAQVQSWIKEQLKQAGRPSHSRFLREFRASGQACEQKRFARLYQGVIAEP